MSDAPNNDNASEPAPDPVEATAGEPTTETPAPLAGAENVSVPPVNPSPPATSTIGGLRTRTKVGIAAALVAVAALGVAAGAAVGYHHGGGSDRGRNEQSDGRGHHQRGGWDDDGGGYGPMGGGRNNGYGPRMGNGGGPAYPGGVPGGPPVNGSTGNGSTGNGSTIQPPATPQTPTSVPTN
jgi:hypothetical protein